MKKTILPFFFLLVFATTSYSQKVPYNVVFDVTSKDTLVHQMVIRWINEITKMDATANVEVVFYAKSLDMITKGKSTVEKDVLKYAATKNITFKVCEVAMKNNQVEKGDLMTGVQMVPDGIYEIITKQSMGWGYIKASR